MSGGIEEALDRAATVIADARRLVLVCHVGPDGDALGSMLGLAVAARRAGIEVHASFGEPFTLPDTYRFLPIDLLVKPGAVPATPEVVVTFDAGSLDRLGNLASVAAAAGTLIVIDHHASNTGFGHINLVDPAAAATAEIVHLLLKRLGWQIDPVVATCLHTGIVTDTGRFQYSNTTPQTLVTASRLVEAGARPEVVGQHIYEEVPFGYLSLAAAVLARARLDPDRRVVWTVLTKEDLDRAGISLDEADPLIDAVRVARESDVAMLVKEVESGRVKVSLRSRGRVDVGAIAVELGGGGHHNAAGFTHVGTSDDAISQVLARLAPVSRS